MLWFQLKDSLSDIILITAASAALGYYLGRRTSALEKHVSSETRPATEEQEEQTQEDDDDNDEEEEDIADGDLSSISAGFMEQCKMVRVTQA